MRPVEGARGPRASHLALLGVVPLVFLAAARIAFPYDLGHYEASTWAPAELLVAGHNPYATWRTLEPPYVMAPYGPAFYALIGVGLRAFGRQLWFGRLVASVALAASAVCIWLLVRRFRSAPNAWLAVLAYAAWHPVQAWLGVHRPDAIALACGLAAVVLATGRSRHVGFSVLAAGLAALALFFRQTAVVPALVVGAWSVLARSRREQGAIAIAFGLSFALPTALLEATARHGYLWQAYVLPASVALRADPLVRIARAFAWHAGTWVVLGTVGASLARGRVGRRAVAAASEARRFTLTCVAAAIVSAAVALVTSLRVGSNVNYWLEVGAWLALTVGMLAPAEIVRGRIAAAALAAAVVIDAARGLSVEWVRRADRPHLDEIVTTLDRLGDAGECVVAVYPEIPAAAGMTAYFNDGIQYDGRAPQQYAALRRALTERRCAALVLPFPEAPRGYVRVDMRTPPSSMLPAYVFRRVTAD